MAAAPAPNLEAFRAFLKSRASQEPCVTRVTAVTSKESGTCRLQEFVTGVTGIAGSIRECLDADERQAIAEIEGGIPPLYAAGFAQLQLTPPPDLPDPRWLQAVDDAGHFLDAFGQQARAMGWQADDLFRPNGLVQILQGAHVTKITFMTAVLSDGRTFKRLVSEERR